MSFHEWAFQQCVIQGHIIRSIKNDVGENILWFNTTTQEKFILRG